MMENSLAKGIFIGTIDWGVGINYLHFFAIRYDEYKSREIVGGIPIITCGNETKLLDDIIYKYE